MNQTYLPIRLEKNIHHFDSILMIDVITAPGNELVTQPKSLKRAAAKLMEDRNGIMRVC